MFILKGGAAHGWRAISPWNYCSHALRLGRRLNASMDSSSSELLVSWSTFSATWVRSFVCLFLSTTWLGVRVTVVAGTVLLHVRRNLDSQCLLLHGIVFKASSSRWDYAMFFQARYSRASTSGACIVDLGSRIHRQLTIQSPSSWEWLMRTFCASSSFKVGYVLCTTVLGYCLISYACITFLLVIFFSVVIKWLVLLGRTEC